MLIEIRNTGCQTVLPGSVHPSGELVESTPGTKTIVSIDEDSLLKAAGKTASASLLAREWVGMKGSRHEATLALSGALLHSGWPGR